MSSALLFELNRSSVWRRSREYVAVDLLPECTDRVEAMAILTHFRCGYYIVARDVGRPVPANTQGLGTEIDSPILVVDLFPRTRKKSDINLGLSSHVETVVLLSQQRPNDKIRVELDLTEFDITAAEKEATYQEIKDYILDKHGVNVSSLYIAQVKEKLGIKERENYNLPKNVDSKHPQCPKEKEKMIVEALKNFKMI